jgi:hypothetical protein
MSRPPFTKGDAYAVLFRKPTDSYGTSGYAGSSGGPTAYRYVNVDTCNTATIATVQTTQRPSQPRELEDAGRRIPLWLSSQQALSCAKAMASLLSPSQLKELEAIFSAYDTSGEGLIDHKELGVMLRAMGLFCTEAEVQDMIVLVDTDGSGKLDFPEFLNLMTSRYAGLLETVFPQCREG